MRSLIWDCTCPFSRFWTTVLAILVRWPMLPLLVPPSALEISEAVLEAPTLNQISLIKRSGEKKNKISSYWILSFSSQACKILCTKRHFWKSCVVQTDRKLSACMVASVMSFFYVYLWQSVKLENALQAFLYIRQTSLKFIFGSSCRHWV